MPVSEENRGIAKYLASAIGGKPAVTRYWDDNHSASVDILAVLDRPQPGVTVYGTLGLSDHTIGSAAEALPLRVEFLGACDSGFPCYPNILATCGFNVINTKMSCSPGTVFPRVVEMYAPYLSMKHVLFVPPFLWDLQSLTFTSKKVAFLLAVPISDSERDFAEKNGSDALEELFQARQIDVFDLARASVA